MHINDPNLIEEIEALCPPPLAAPPALFTPQQQNDVTNVSDTMLMLEMLDEQLDQEQNRPNQRAFWQFDFELRDWDAHGRTAPLPHLPHAVSLDGQQQWRGYVLVDLNKFVNWFGRFELTKQIGSSTYGQDAPPHDYLVEAPPIAAPQIEAATLPAPIDLTASPVGAPMGAGYFQALAGAAFLPDGTRLSEPRSSTGFVLLVKAPPSPFYPAGLNYFIVAP